MRADYLENNSGQSNVLAKVQGITAAITLTAADSGKVFMVENAGSAYTITLPATLASGLQYEFFVRDDQPSAAVTIAAGSAIIDGNVLSGDATTAKAEVTAGTAKSNVIIGAGARQGAYLKFVSDGSTWYFTGSGTPDNWVTTS